MWKATHFCWRPPQVVVSRFGKTEPHVDFHLDALPVSSEMALQSPQRHDGSLLLVTGNKVNDTAILKYVFGKRVKHFQENHLWKDRDTGDLRLTDIVNRVCLQ